MAITVGTYSNEVVRASDLFTTQRFVQDLAFENCLIVGPGILVLEESVLDGGTFDKGADALLYRLEPHPREAVGALVFRNCSFINCRFERIGFLLNNESFEQFRSALGSA